MGGGLGGGMGMLHDDVCCSDLPHRGGGSVGECQVMGNLPQRTNVWASSGRKHAEAQHTRAVSSGWHGAVLASPAALCPKAALP